MSNAKKAKLDIILTHYDEPWEVGKKFFDMLSLQRSVDFSTFRVVIIQDGKETSLPWDELIGKVPYEYVVHTIKHGGVVKARNEGIEFAEADWIMFCDFDDMFTNVCSLKLIVNVLPAYDTDMLWMESWREEKRSGDFVNKLKENQMCTFAKVYRREALNKYGIRFNEQFTHQYESLFNSLAFSCFPGHKVKKIDMPFAPYMKTLRKDSYNLREENIPIILSEMLLENVVTADIHLARLHKKEMKKFTVDALFDAYFIMNYEPIHVTDKVRGFMSRYIADNKAIIGNVDQSTIEIAYELARGKISAFTQHAYNFYKLELMPPEDNFDKALDWIMQFDYPEETNEHTVPVQQVYNPKDERIVVYCGTRNTYDCMLTSAKSVLAHTKVDRIYLLTEDDEFPQPLPDIIRNINVSGQKYFKKDGANYSNAWTYMCLMRGAFPKLFPQHSKILSLDVDVIIEDDISDLFDLDLSNYYLAGVHEPPREQKDYINFGVVMMNLDKIRCDHIDDKVINSLNTRQWDCPEQSCFSHFCEGHILLLPSDYNYTPHSSITEDTDNRRIIHYAGIKYWKYFTPYRTYANMTWEELCK